MGRVRCGLMLGLAIAGLCACVAPAATDLSLGCGETPETSVARPVMCGADVPQGGVGRQGDGLLASLLTRAVVRRPLTGAISHSSLDGGTLVDWADWDGDDVLREVIPLVDGNWMAVDSYTGAPDEWRVGGSSKAVPGIAGGPEGAPVNIAWRIEGREVVADGADALLIRPKGRYEAFDDHVEIGDRSIGFWGTASTAEGPLVVQTDRLILGSTSSVLAELWQDQTRISGRAIGANLLEVYADDRLAGTVRVDGDAFDLVVPDSATRIRLRGEDGAFVDSEPETGLDLQLGPSGLIEVAVIQDLDLVRVARWSGRGGRGSVALEPDGGTVPTGPGTISLTVGSKTQIIEVGASKIVDVTFDFRTGFALHRIDLDVPGARSDRWSGTDADALNASSDQGHVWTVLTGDADISAGVNAAPLSQAHQTGTRSRTDAGVAIVAWPYTANARRAGHGAPSIAGLNLADAIAALSTRGRRSLLSIGSLDAVSSDVSPTHIALGHPGTDPELSAWKEWFDRLNQGAWPAPVGPITWLAGGGSEGLQAEAEIVAGTLIAGAGPVLTLRVNGGLGGQTVARPRGSSDTLNADIAVVTVHQIDAATELLLIGDGRVLARRDQIEPGTIEIAVFGSPSWLIAVLRGPGSEAWATTAAVRFAPSE